MVKVSSKYQVVIPEDVRGALGIKPGLQVDVIAKGGVAYIVPLRPLDDIRRELKGRASAVPLRDKKDRSL